MDKVLLDTSTYIDLEKANKSRRQSWAINTLRNMLAFRSKGGVPYLCMISVIEILRGLRGNLAPEKAISFESEVGIDFNLITLDATTSFLAAKIISSLDSTRLSIGLADSIIAATALQNDLTLITSNLEHFLRVVDAGYDLKLVSWRSI